MDRRLRKSTSTPPGHSSSYGQLVLMEEGFEQTAGDGEENGSKGKRRGGSDVSNMALLVLLYAMQGVPLGLSLGSIPFILKANATYTEIGMFSLAGYPYALKLLWSPLVDTLFHPAIGCRKSWVLPIQMTSGLLMIFSASAAQHWLDTANVRAITSLFFVFVLLAATQDIAVDGWALTLLSRHNIGHASTCQTIGINTGYFASFTIFLALNDPSFCNRYLRTAPQDQGLVSLAHYFTFWGYVYIVVTLLLLFKSEKPPPPPTAPHPASPSSHGPQQEGQVLASPVARSTGRQLARRAASSVDKRAAMSTEASTSQETDSLLGGGGGGEAEVEGAPGGKGSGSSVWGKAGGEDGSARGWKGGRAVASGEGSGPGTTRQLGVRRMYRRLWKVAMLKYIRSLTTVLLLCKLGTITAEAAGVFKLMEKGVTRETISLIVLVEFPLELLFALFAGRWASGGRPFDPWLTGYFLRLAMAALTTLLVATFPEDATLHSAPWFYAAIVATGVATSFASTLMFVSQGTFFARISDSSMGGTYLTLLNTISNLGSAWPKFFVFILMDGLTIQSCMGVDSQGPNGDYLTCPMKPSVDIVNPCVAAGGTCVKGIDGFYPLSFALVLVGFYIGNVYRKQLHELEAAKDESWRA